MPHCAQRHTHRKWFPLQLLSCESHGRAIPPRGRELAAASAQGRWIPSACSQFQTQARKPDMPTEPRGVCLPPSCAPLSVFTLILDLLNGDASALPGSVSDLPGCPHQQAGRASGSSGKLQSGKCAPRKPPATHHSQLQLKVEHVKGFQQQAEWGSAQTSQAKSSGFPSVQHRAVLAVMEFAGSAQQEGGFPYNT